MSRLFVAVILIAIIVACLWILFEGFIKDDHFMPFGVDERPSARYSPESENQTKEAPSPSSAENRQHPVVEFEPAVRKDWGPEEKALREDLLKYNFLRHNPEVEAQLQILNAEQEKRMNNTSAGIRHGLHLFYTIDCTHYSLWQALLLEHSWARVGQTGSLTRLVSGCIKEDGSRDVLLRDLKRVVTDHPRLFVFFAPPFSIDKAVNTSLRNPALNRPAIVFYWLARAPPMEDTLGMLDPDMLFLKPLVASPVFRGFPVGHLYDYMLEPSVAWDRIYSQVCLNCPPRTPKEDFCIGPPMFMHRLDWEDLVQWWIRYAVELTERSGTWISEMGGWSLGMAHIGLHPKTNSSLMWSYGYDAEESLKKAGLKEGSVMALPRMPNWTPLGLHPMSNSDVPSLLHYCYAYEVGLRFTRDALYEWEQKNMRPQLLHAMFSKYGMRYPWHEYLLDCKHGLFEYPSLTTLLRYVAKTPLERGQSALISALVPAFNAAMKEYRRRYCLRYDTRGKAVKATNNVRLSVSGPWNSQWETVDPASQSIFGLEEHELAYSFRYLPRHVVEMWSPTELFNESP